MTEVHNDNNKNKHIPIIIGNSAPFRLVTRKTDKWDPTLEQINDRTYDYVKLSRISGFVDIGITPYSIGIGFDGSLILPGKGYKKPLNLTVQDKDVKERQKHCLNFRVKKKNT